MSIVICPVAEADAYDAAQWYEQQSLGKGSSFLAQIDKAVEAIERNPRLYPLVSPPFTSREYRRRVMKRFDYSVIYEVTAIDVRVVAVVHNKRRSNFWHNRIP